MRRSRRIQLAIGIFLVLLGALFLAEQLFPGWPVWDTVNLTWPWLIIGLGGFLFILGLILDESSMAVPASIVAGIGCILYWQHESGDWISWMYAWTLIPGFVGIGVILRGLLEGKWRGAFRKGLTLITISIILFLIFAALFGGSTFAATYWPLALVFWGLLLLANRRISLRVD